MNIQLKPNEVFVPAKTFKGEYPNYIVSNMGRCYNLKTKRFVGFVNKKGYTNVGLYNNNGETELCVMILRLMLISFDIPIPNELRKYPLNKVVADHIDGDPTNNTLENARWLYRQDNAHTPEANRKFSNAVSKPILQYSKTGEFIKEWSCANEVQRELGIWQTSISKCCKSKLKSCGGYIWRYKIA